MYRFLTQISSSQCSYCVLLYQCRRSTLKVRRSRCTWTRQSGPGQSSWECQSA